MKRIVVFILLVANVYLAINQYLKYRRYNPGRDYNYIAKTKEIDANYHDTKLVTEYFELAHKAGSFARKVWYNEGIDVLYEDQTNPQSQNAVQAYNQMLARIKHLEAKLIASKKMKAQGLDNKAIKFVEKKGITPKNYELFQRIEKQPIIKGDTTLLTWEVQNQLIKKGYKIPLDGKYRDVTEEAIMKFQIKNKIFASGKVDERTLRLLLK
ncbi:peptidoglycan-binding domain-containing protein [Microscilla marina]|uniref:Putative peptidoglycan binding domain protein n=1 Tax=Microscilla marina ATCC 23134 TaxID=313606 RepID=A1ZMT0_MICM2|nr:peptidoglycan-binding domain-containing protein [Microscilla marina]EAY28460.1 putative peptidoglycan binding domain protein [Microscilla marina ATCC 23134]